jgi:uridine kinase
MNIIEAYIKLKGQLIILVSGLPGCGKTTVAKKISKDFGKEFILIDQFDYYIDGYDKKVKLPDGSEVLDVYNNDAVDWKKLNKDIDAKKSTGIIVTGIAFPDDKLDFTPDYHIHLSISKKECLDRKRTYLEKHKDKYSKELEDMESSKEKLKMNQLLYPYYLETIKQSKINKFININNLDDNQAYDSAFDIIISYIQFFLNSDEGKKLYFEKMYKKDKDTGETETDTDTTNDTDSDESEDEKDSKIKSGPIEFILMDSDEDD